MLSVVPKHYPIQSTNLTPIEKTIKDIWAELLLLGANTPITENSDFFSLGGSSLQAAQVIQLIQKKTQIKLSLVDLFENSTIRTLALKLKQYKKNNNKLATIQRHIQTLPLSFAQRRLWLSYQAIREKSPAAYNLKLALKFKGLFKLTEWNKTLQCLFNRHEILRTYYPVTGMQQVGFFDIELEHHIISSTLNNRRKAVENIINKIADHNFGDLSKPPLIRTAVIKISEQEFVLLFIFHHIIFDEFSVPNLINAMVETYNNVIDKRTVLCNPVPVQYSDFVFWQQSMFKQGRYNSAFIYWKKQLSGSTNQLNLPTDKIHQGAPTFEGEAYVFYIDKSQLKRLRDFAQQESVSLFTLLFSSIATLLYRYTYQEDFNIGIAYNHRRDSTIDPLIGFFVNMLPIRVQIKGQYNFKQALTQIKLTLLKAYQHSAPIEEIINQLNLSQSSYSAHPLFQVAIVMHDLPHLNMNFKGLKASLWNKSLILGGDLHSSKFNLSFEIATLGESKLSIKIEYATDIFVKQTIQRMASYWRMLLSGLIEDSQDPIDKVSLLTHTEEKKLIQRWSKRGRCYAQNKNILQVFLAQVRKRPRAIAVVDKETRLTYRQLNEKANQLAHYILAMNRISKHEQIIAVALQRSLDFIISILAILKTGSAYLPLDPDLPIHRLRFMINDAKVRIVITKSQYREKIISSKLPIIFLNELQIIKKLSAQSKINPKKNISSNNLAYIIYTSGSTGEPKGVMVEHNSIIQLSKNPSYIKLTTNDIIAQISDTMFDASVFEIWAGLLNGLKIVIFPKIILLSVSAFKAQLVKNKINIIVLPATLFHRFLTIDKAMFKAIKYLFFVGEKLPNFNLILQLLNDKKNAPKYLINGYGPTENTVFSTTYTMSSDCSAFESIPIGRPTQNTLTYILNDQHMPLPMGVPGELYLGGFGLARGYLNRPKLTKERFIPNAFLKDGSRLYRTGDWVRSLPNGNLIFLGRMDNQVKISGYRIELGEIENVIAAQKSIQEVAVKLQVVNNEKYIIAYVTLKEKQSKIFSKEKLLSTLAEQLPTYMLPKAIIILKKFPLTASGKLNRQALSLVDIENKKKGPCQWPTSVIEKSIESLWQKVLYFKERISLTDNFFNLGGNSLLAMELNNQINKNIKNVTYSNLFSKPTIQAQAKLLENTDTHLNKSTAITHSYLMKEAKLNADIQLPKNVPLAQSNTSKAILLTGATGFLGVFLLVELLNTTQADIYCLIRAESSEKAHLRLLANISQHKISDRINLKRVKAIAGDISDRHLGLSKDDYRKLSHHIDVIYHAASMVNFMQPYSASRASNVLGTKHLLYFSIHHKVKPLHYISSAAVFSFAHYFNTNKKLCLEEPVKWDADLAKALPKDLGYTQTKAVAEKLLDQARKHGLPITIYRVGFILCHSQSGIGHNKQLWSRLIRDCIALKFFPEFDNLKEEFVTVDYAAKTIVYISKQPNTIGKIFHIMPKAEHNITTNQLFDMIKINGKKLKPESYKKWIDRLQMFIQSGGRSNLQLMMPFFTESIIDGLTLLELYQRSPIFSINNTQFILQNTKIVDGYVSSATIKRYLEFLAKRSCS